MQTAMMTWHAEFESRAPEAHHEFLRSLGIPEDEAQHIRERSRAIGGEGSPYFELSNSIPGLVNATWLW